MAIFIHNFFVIWKYLTLNLRKYEIPEKIVRGRIWTFFMSAQSNKTGWHWFNSIVNSSILWPWHSYVSPNLWITIINPKWFFKIIWYTSSKGYMHGLNYVLFIFLHTQSNRTKAPHNVIKYLSDTINEINVNLFC